MLWRRDQKHYSQAHRRGKILLCIIWWNHRYLTFLPVNSLCVLRVPEQQTWRFSWIYKWLMNKSDDVRFMYWGYVYVTAKQSIMPWQGHFLFFVIFTIRSVPITAMRWPSLEKFILGLSDILFMTCFLCVSFWWFCRMCSLVATLLSGVVSGPLNLSTYALTKGPPNYIAVPGFLHWSVFCGLWSFALRLCMTPEELVVERAHLGERHFWSRLKTVRG